MKSIYLSPLRGANERAAQVLAKLAPGYTHDLENCFLRNAKRQIVAHGAPGFMYCRDGEGLNGTCVANTFGDLDFGIPNAEMLLTVHLWRKLFPAEFRTRPYFGRR